MSHARALVSLVEVDVCISAVFNAEEVAGLVVHIEFACSRTQVRI